VGDDTENFKVFGYTGRMPDLMKIADLFIGKPGGLTSAEALACGLPMVILSPIPGQEERNSDHLLEDGVAVKCNEMTTIPYKIDSLLDDPLRLEEMRRKAFSLSRPEAAKTVVETLVADEVSALEVTDDEAEAITMAAGRERDFKAR
jgi:processive 1,2-diacylglycerol beta-glucosyltransferase